MKKLISTLVILSMILTLTVNVFARTNQPTVPGTDITWPRDLPKDTEIIDISDLKDGETLEVELYIQNPNTRASFEILYSTLLITKSGNSIKWAFVPLPVTGNPFHSFKGSNTIYNRSGLSMGTEYIDGPTAGSRTYYEGGVFSISGTYTMLGWGSKQISKAVVM